MDGVANKVFWAAMLLAGALTLAVTWVGDAGSVGRGASGNATAADPPLALRVDIARHEVQLLADGHAVRRFDLLLDVPDHVPRRGTYEIRRIAWTPRWAPAHVRRSRRAVVDGEPPRPAGRIRIPLGDTGFWIHAVDDPGPRELAATHACVRMRQTDLRTLASLLLDSAGARSPTWMRRVLHGAAGTAETWLEQPIPVVVR